jgi:lysophospholipase L1-like esterase
MKSRVSSAVLCGLLVVTFIVGAWLPVTAQSGAPRWVTAWATSQQDLGPTGVSNASVRMIARVTAAGEAVRIRLDNTYGAEPLEIGAAAVGQPMRGARLAPGSNQPVRFGGNASVTIPPGERVTSDPVRMAVRAGQDLAVSLHVPGAGVRPSRHRGALTTSYLSADGAGDVTADETGEPFGATTTSMWWLKAIDVHSRTSAGTVVAFGDSITDGSCATVDGHDRWEDWLAVRLALAAAEQDVHKAIVNEGIGGNTVTRAGLRPPPVSTPGIERLERDVFSHHGVTHVVLFMGTNDIRRDATAGGVIAGMDRIVREVQARGIAIVGATIIPRHNRAPTPDNSGWTPAKTAIRNRVNAWMRDEAPFDAVLDFDAVTRRADDADRLEPALDCDGVHPNVLGYYEMGRSIPLDLFAP